MSSNSKSSTPRTQVAFLVAAMLLVALGASISAPQAAGLIFRTDKPEKPASPPPVQQSNKNVGPSTPSCVIVTVTVDDKDNGVLWDLPGRSPDPRISELSTGASAKCDDTFTCQIRVEPKNSQLSFNIVDYDPLNQDDFIGSGVCKVGSSCRLGQSSISMASC